MGFYKGRGGKGNASLILDSFSITDSLLACNKFKDFEKKAKEKKVMQLWAG